MKIVHVCLSCFYVDSRHYQENELVRQHVSEGHDVLVIASTETHSEDGTTSYRSAGGYLGSDGAPVVRLPYRLWPASLAHKLRVHPGVYQLLSEFQPDAILFHGACGWEIINVARFCRANPQVLFYIDSHEDWHNSARNFLSREVLHKLYYRFCLRRAWPVAGAILCISTETMDFVESVYRVPRSKLEFFPLAGHPVQPNTYSERRARTRAELGIRSDQILFVQSGKQTRRKKLVEALLAFERRPLERFVMVIAGSLAADIRTEAEKLISRNPAIRFLGWKDVEALTDLLCAADIYLQPGTQSVSMQHSLCCHCAVIIDDVPSHHIYLNGNGWLINDVTPLEKILEEVGQADLATLQERSYEFAKNFLDYSMLSQRVLRAY